MKESEETPEYEAKSHPPSFLKRAEKLAGKKHKKGGFKLAEKKSEKKAEKKR